MFGDDLKRKNEDKKKSHINRSFIPILKFEN